MKGNQRNVLDFRFQIAFLFDAQFHWILEFTMQTALCMDFRFRRLLEKPLRWEGVERKPLGDTGCSAVFEAKTPFDVTGTCTGCFWHFSSGVKWTYPVAIKKS